jgi:hypothetical protein
MDVSSAETGRPAWPAGAPPPLRPGPLAGVYPAAAAMVVLFLVPYLGLSSALSPLEPLICAQLHMSPQTISLASGMANAVYALGTVLAVPAAPVWKRRREPAHRWLAAANAERRPVTSPRSGDR